MLGNHSGQLQLTRTEGHLAGDGQSQDGRHGLSGPRPEPSLRVLERWPGPLASGDTLVGLHWAPWGEAGDGHAHQEPPTAWLAVVWAGLHRLQRGRPSAVTCRCVIGRWQENQAPVSSARIRVGHLKGVPFRHRAPEKRRLGQQNVHASVLQASGPLGALCTQAVPHCPLMAVRANVASPRSASC